MSIKDVSDLHKEMGPDKLKMLFEQSGHALEVVPFPTVESKTSTLPGIISSRHLITDPPARPEVLIEGLLHQGSKMVLGGGSKSYKTWCLMDLALSVAAGVPWWGLKTHQGRVLYINLEIQDGFFCERLQVIHTGKGLDDAVWDQLDVQNLRGHCADFQKLRDQIIEGAGNKYALIVIDPFYKVLGDRDENSAGSIGHLLNDFEKVAVQTGAAVLYGHHFSKGNQAKKESIDRMSGSGVFARDADSLLVMTKHENDDVYAIEATLRNFKPIEPFCVKWEYPLMQRDRTSSPSQLKQCKANTKKYTTDQLINVLGIQSLSNKDWQAETIATTGMSPRTFASLLKELKESEEIILDTKTNQWTATKIEEGA